LRHENSQETVDIPGDKLRFLQALPAFGNLQQTEQKPFWHDY
jgi:hypothetical protein